MNTHTHVYGFYDTCVISHSQVNSGKNNFRFKREVPEVATESHLLSWIVKVVDSACVHACKMHTAESSIHETPCVF